jgi:hypothetical protein
LTETQDHNDAGFRQYGRPENPDERRVDPSKMAAVQEAETALHFVKVAVWSDDQHLQQKYTRKLIIALEPLRLEVFGVKN